MSLEKALGFDDSELAMIEVAENYAEVSGELPSTMIPASMTREEAVELCAKRHLYWSSMLEAVQAKYKPIIEALEGDISLIKQKLEWYERQIECALPPGEESEHITESVDVRYRSNKKCEVINEEEVPIEYTRVKTEVDKVAALKALKDGEEIKGLKLTTSYSLQIKPGGIRALDNKRKRDKDKLKQAEVMHIAKGLNNGL